MSLRKLIVNGKIYAWAILFAIGAWAVFTFRAIKSGGIKRRKRHAKPSVWDDERLGVHNFVEVNNVRLHYVLKGDIKKPLILLLHGYPECWFSWRGQLKGLELDQYCIVAPDMRGYGESDKPADSSSYDWRILVEDVKCLIRQLGHERAIVAGHDWGGIVAWAFAATHPEMTAKLIILNAPNPLSFGKLISESWSQHVKSYYMFVYQLPFLPEFHFQLSDFHLYDLIFRDSNGIRFADDQEIEVYKYAFSNGANSITGPINYYRAFLKLVKLNRDALPGKVSAPTLIIWGRADKFLDQWFAADAHNHVQDGATIDVHYIENVGHFVQTEAANVVNEKMKQFIEP